MVNKSIMIVGVGGQGTLLASKLIGGAAMEKGCDVKVSEVHGMSQRGGSVVTYVKYGENIASPVINKGEADIIIAFEQLEAARWLEYLKKGGKMIVNVQKLNPMTVITGAAKYPENIIDKLKATGAEIFEIDALETAEKAGSIKTVNTVLLGYAAGFMDFSHEIWTKVIKSTVPEKFVEVNLKAFEDVYEEKV